MRGPRSRCGSDNAGYHVDARWAKMPNAKGDAAELLADGRWLTPGAACEALGCTRKSLERRWREGDLKRRAIGPRCYLYYVEVDA